MPSLYFSCTDDSVLISGKTFNIKDRLKEVGGRWNPKTSLWSIPTIADTPEVRQELETLATQKKKDEAATKKAARLYAKSPEGKAAAAAEDKLRIKAAVAAGSTWICCENCEVIDWDRHHTSCATCGHDGNTFFVDGRLRTGD
jgi:hypothetical protein